MTELKDFKFLTTLEFKKIESDDKAIYSTFYSNSKAEAVIKAIYSTFYSNSKAETVINESDINDVLESVYGTIISSIQKSLGNGSVWIIDSVIDHNINISKYNPLAGSSYIKLPKKKKKKKVR